MPASTAYLVARLPSEKELATRIERSLRSPIGAIREPEVEVRARGEVQHLCLGVRVLCEVDTGVVHRLIEDLARNDGISALIERIIQSENTRPTAAR